MIFTANYICEVPRVKFNFLCLDFLCVSSWKQRDNMKPKNDYKLEAKEPYILKTCVVELGRIPRSGLGSSGIE